MKLLGGGQLKEQRSYHYITVSLKKMLPVNVGALRPLNPFDLPQAEDLQVMVSTYRRCCEAPEAPEAPGAVSSGWAAEQKEALSTQHLTFSRSPGAGGWLWREEEVGRE